MTSTNLYPLTLSRYRYPLYIASLLLLFIIFYFSLFGQYVLNLFLNCTVAYEPVSKHFTVRSTLVVFGACDK
jgi:hypothetical protein